MTSERTRTYLNRISSRAEADALELNNAKKDDSPKSSTSPPATLEKPRYIGYKSPIGENATYGSLRKAGVSTPNVNQVETPAYLPSLKRNGHSGSQGNIATTTSSISSSTPSLATRFSSSTYIPIGKRLQNSYLGGSTGSTGSTSTIDSNNTDTQDDQIGTSTSRREAREAFLRGEAQKYDPMSRERETPSIKTEREREKEKDRQAYTPAPSNANSDRPSRTGPKEIIADGYVGFANLPNQVYRKAVKRGFEFTLMVVGESGLGKSTLINSMFLTDLYSNEYPGPSQRTKKTVQVDTTQVILKEGGVHLRLTVVDTPGFGDAVDNSNCWQPITDHIEMKYEEYLNSESRVHRKTQPDLRVHCCLYFISPNGHGLKPLDIEFMRRLHDKVNVIPLIAKADTLTPEECREFKKTVLNEIAQHKIRIYEFPDGDDEEEARMQKKLKERVPFGVVGSNTVVESGGRKVRGRVYPWGTVEVENLEHNDFVALRNMLIRTHMQDLKDVTNNVHYENYRYNKLATVGQDGKTKGSGKSPLLQLDEERREHEAKMKKMEAEMEQVFEMKVKEKKNKLKESEADLQRKSEQMKRTQDQQEKELEEKLLNFEKERKLWEEQERHLTEQLRTLDKECVDKKLTRMNFSFRKEKL